MVVFVECVLFDKSDDHSKCGAFVKFAFQKLEKVIGQSLKNPGYINAHESIIRMQLSQLKMSCIITIISIHSLRIDSRIDQTRQENLVKNRHILCSVIDAIVLCDEQALALCGHRDDSTADASSHRGAILKSIFIKC